MPYSEEVKEDYPHEGYAMSGWFVAIMILVAFFIPFLGPGLTFIVGIVNFRRRGGILLAVLAVIIIFVHIIYFPPNFVRAMDRMKEANVRTGLTTIEAALDQYRGQHDGTYPEDFSGLAGSQFLPQLPRNPYSLDPMTHVPFDEGPSPGDLTYVPVTTDGDVTGYYLLGYGSRFNKGLDVDDDGEKDYVMILLSSEDDTGEELPPISDLLD